MKRQIVVIHGGDAYDTYEEYIEALKKEPFELKDLFYNGWKKKLQERLGDRYQVIAPRMPNSNNARYLEWKIWFDKIIPFLTDGLILIGHSLGGIFLARYLSENKLPIKIIGIMLVAAPHTDNFKQSMADFINPQNTSLFKDQAGEIFLYFSKDDQIVPIDSLSSYERDLPQARVRIFSDRGHFNQEEFPEIVEDIKKLK
jgi:uncharacterized protein